MRTVSLVILLIIILAIPLTVIVLQSQQDIRQRAADGAPYYGGTQTVACGEIVGDIPLGSKEGIVTYRPPVSINNQWETRKKDGTVLKQEDIRNKMRNSHFYSGSNVEYEVTRLVPNPNPDSVDYHPETITCRLYFDYNLYDCRVKFVDPLQAGKSNENWLYVGAEPKDIQLRIEENPKGTSPGQCELEVHIHTPPEGSVTPPTTVTPTPGSAPSITPVAGTGIIQGYKRVEPSGHAIEPASSQAVSLDGGTPITTNPYAFGGVTPGSHPVTVTVPAGYTVKYSVCQNISTCHEDKTQWKDGPSATVNVVANQYVDLYWHYIASVTPTSTAPPTNTPPLTRTPTPSSMPTSTVTIIPTIPSTPTLFSLGVVLPGIGKNGNVAPNNASRSFLLQLFDASSKKIGSDIRGSADFDAQSGSYMGTVNVGSIIPSGNYTVKVKLDQFLTKTVALKIGVTAGVTNALPIVTLVSGDSNNDNTLDVLDYNILVSCFGRKINSDGCGGRKVDTDLNDDGVIDGIDYNLFIGGIKIAKKGD